jgi:hypothetical protein
MGLRMSSPTKHRTTGVYYFRERVPADLVEMARGRRIVVPIGDEQRDVTLGAEVKVSLDAREPRLVKERLCSSASIMKCPPPLVDTSCPRAINRKR